MSAFKLKTIWWICGFLGLVAIMGCSLMPGQPGPQWIPHLDKVLHFSVYAIATFFFQQLTKNRKLATIFLFLLTYSGLIELIQNQLPSRQMSALDLFANASGCLVGSFCSVIIFRHLLIKLDDSLAGLFDR